MLDSRRMGSLIFVVGTARSGTSLIQEQLVRELQAYSGPETHIFRPQRSWLFLRRPARWRFLRKSQRLFFGSKLARLARRGAAGAAKALGRLADEYGLVVEKTPSHLQSMEPISGLLPEAHFIHCIREPASLARSLYIASRQNQELWRAMDIRQIQERIHGDLLIHSRCVGEPKHHFVRYERWREDLDRMIPALPRGHSTRSAPLVLEEELWRTKGFSSSIDPGFEVPSPESLLDGEPGRSAMTEHAALQRKLEALPDP